MKINSANNINFKGTFYTTSDSHGRLKMTAGVITEVEKRIQNQKEPVFFIDGGDFIGELYPLDIMTEFYLKAKKRNQRVNFIFNLGNVELDMIANGKKEALSAIDALTAGGIDVINASYFHFAKQLNLPSHNIKPYKIVEDIVNGRKQKIFITGFTEYDATKNAYNLNDCKEQLKTLIAPAIKETKPDKVVLMMHTYQGFTDDTLEFAKKELGIDNIELVVGGHPHSIDDYKNDKTRVLYHPQHSKAAYEIKNTKKGFELNEINPTQNHYNYAPLSGNPSIITNLDISKPLPIADAYNKILTRPSLNGLNNKISSNPVYLKARDEYEFKYSSPSALGTFMANAVKDYVGADIGFLLSLDFREHFPKAGVPITYYNLSDAVNVEKPVYKVESINTKGLQDILEASLLFQNKGESNRNFLEYSDNLKIERYVGVDKNDRKVKQIYFKENGKWIALLDKSFGAIYPDKIFSVATCKILATGKRSGFGIFQEFPSKEIPATTNRKIFALKLKELESSGKTSYEASEIIDCDNPE